MNLNIRNAVIVALVQALLGAVSENFGVVLVRFSEGLHVEFYIDQKLEEDMEEIDDVITEFDSLVMGICAVSITFEVNVGVENVDFSGADVVPVYIRRG